MDINQAKTYKALILLNCMLSPDISGNVKTFRTVLNGDDKMLQPLFIDLLVKNYVTVVNDHYEATKVGEGVFDTFNGRFREFLKVFDPYAMVDSAAGEFAMEKFYDFNTDAEWDVYKNQERFFDFRIPVATFKGINAHEVVFMSFLKNNRFDTSSTGWQMDLLSDAIWAEIDEICRTAVTIEDLGTGLFNTLVAEGSQPTQSITELGTEVLENMIKKGTQVMMTLMDQELEFNKKRLAELQAMPVEVEAGSDEDEEVTVVTTTIVEYEDDLVYYDAYWDPWYYSPIWIAPLFIW